MDLQELYNHANSKFTFDEKSYPALVQLLGIERENFALKHILIHQQKVLGKISSIMESADHGDPIDKDYMSSEITKLFMNSLQMAGAAGISFEDFSKQVGKWEEATE